MRWIVLALLLFNGAFFAWQYYAGHGNHGAEQAALEQGKYPPLTLISELSPEQRKALGVTPKNGDDATPVPTSQTPEAEAAGPAPAQTEETPASKPEPKVAEKKPEPPSQEKTTSAKSHQPAKHAYCYALGPVGNHRLVNQIKRRVSSMGISVDRVRNEVEKIPTNWIYLGPYRSEATAKRTVQRLHAKGVKDTQLITKGEKNYVISVGLFSTKQGADERLKRLQDAGFTPNVSQVTAKKSHYWLDVSYNGGKAIEKKILSDMVRGIRGAGVKDLPCQTR